MTAKSGELNRTGSLSSLPSSSTRVHPASLRTAFNVSLQPQSRVLSGSLNMPSSAELTARLRRYSLDESSGSPASTIKRSYSAPQLFCAQAASTQAISKTLADREPESIILNTFAQSYVPTLSETKRTENNSLKRRLRDKESALLAIEPQRLSTEAQLKENLAKQKEIQAAKPCFFFFRSARVKTAYNEKIAPYKHEEKQLREQKTYIYAQITRIKAEYRQTMSHYFSLRDTQKEKTIKKELVKLNTFWKQSGEAENRATARDQGMKAIKAAFARFIDLRQPKDDYPQLLQPSLSRVKLKTLKAEAFERDFSVRQGVIAAEINEQISALKAQHRGIKASTNFFTRSKTLRAELKEIRAAICIAQRQKRNSLALRGKNALELARLVETQKKINRIDWWLKNEKLAYLRQKKDAMNCEKSILLDQKSMTQNKRKLEKISKLELETRTRELNIEEKKFINSKGLAESELVLLQTRYPMSQARLYTLRQECELTDNQISLIEQARIELESDAELTCISEKELELTTKHMPSTPAPKESGLYWLIDQ